MSGESAPRDQVGRARVGSIVVVVESADPEVVEAVAVDIARGAHQTGIVPSRLPDKLGVRLGEVDAGGRAQISAADR